MIIFIKNVTILNISNTNKERFMKMKYLISTVFVVTIMTILARSQEYITINMDEIIIKEKKDENVLIFSKKEVEKAKNIYLPDILKYEPDINVIRRAVNGDNSDMLAIRGMSGNRILLNLNGRSLNSAGVVGGYYNDFSVIPLDNIEKIQIMKGGSDVKYGNNVVGGVINVITKEPTQKLDISLFSSFLSGSEIDYMFNERLSISKKYNSFGYVITGSYQKNDEYLWNNNFEAKNIGGIFSYELPFLESKITASIQYTNTERGFIINNRKSYDPTNPLFYQKHKNDYPLAFGDTLNPYGGNISQPGPGSYWIKEKTLLDLDYNFVIKDWFADFKLYKNIENRLEYNYSSHITSPTYPNPDGTLIFKRKVESDRSWGTNFDIIREFEKHIFNSGFEYKYMGYGDIKVYYIDMSYGCFGLTCYGGAASQSADAYSFYIKDEYKFSNRSKLIAGLRYDKYKVNEENNSGIKEFNQDLLNASLSFNYKLSENQDIFLSVYTKYRTPTMPEVYWWSNNQLGYTKTLKSEKNNAAEFSYKIKSNKSIFEFSTYRYSIDDYIMFRFDPKRGVYNIDNVEIYGGSIKYYFDYKSMKPYLNLTIQKTRKGYDLYDPNKLTNEIDYTPRFKLNAGFDYNITDKLSFSGNYRYNDVSHTIYVWSVANIGGSGTTKYYKLINVKPYDIVDIEVKYKLNNVIASIYGDNIFNEKYEEKFGYPMSGRIIGGSLSLKF